MYTLTGHWIQYALVRLCEFQTPTPNGITGSMRLTIAPIGSHFLGAKVAFPLIMTSHLNLKGYANIVCQAGSSATN